MAKVELRTIVLNVRVRPSLKERLQKLAEAEHRTLSNYIELALEQLAEEAEAKGRRR